MAAAVTAAERGAEVTLFESKPRVGKKLSATGNGRCNLTNLSATPKQYHSVQADGEHTQRFIAGVLGAFSPDDAIAFFRGLGLRTVSEDGGRVYPCSSMAGSVVDVLRFAMEAHGVRVYTDKEIRSAKREGNDFVLTADGGDAFHFDRMIVACGGKASPQLGGTDGGYRILKGFGHTVTPLKAALVPLLTENNATRALKGIRAEAALTVLSRGRIVTRTEGEVQFAEDGLSGIPVFDIARAAADADRAVVVLDFAPDETADSLAEMMKRRALACPALTAGDLCTGLVQNRLGKVIVKTAGLGCETLLKELTESDIRAVAESIKAYAFPIAREAGFDRAQVTAGGAVLTEFYGDTMQSKRVRGLYAAGEVLDCHGDCGGFNLQWAWATGILAGRAAAEETR